jgi:hypothetical protein
MKTASLRLALAAGLMLVPAAMAQEIKTDPITKKTVQSPQGGQPQPAKDDHAGHDHGQPTIQQAQPLQAVPQLPPFDRLAKLGPDGKVIRVEGILDILAIPRNKLIDDATREKIRPLVKNWVADVDQLAIDNLDFIEKIEPADGSPGVIDTLEINDMPKVHYVAQMMTQLMSAGPLSAHLEQKEGLNRDQSNLNQQISSDYLQQVMNEIMAAAGTPNDITQKPADEAAKVKQVNAVSRFLYHISCRDAMTSFHRMLVSGAPHMEKAVAGLGLSAADMAKLKEPLAAAKAAKTDAEKQKASRAVLQQLPFDQRRAALQKARELSPAYDPIAELPPQQAAAKAVDGTTTGSR